VGYGRDVRPGRSSATSPLRLSLGALHRSLLAHLDTRAGMRVRIGFEERTSAGAADRAPGTAPGRIEERTFDADLLVRDGRVVHATLTAGGLGAATLTVRVADVDGAARYSIGAGGFGHLDISPQLLDLAEFGFGLDGVWIADAVVDQEVHDDIGRIVIEAETDGDAFARLLQVFARTDPAHPELPLLSHSVTLSAAADVTLDYWWSLLGLDEIDGGPVRNSLITCHVQVSMTAVSDPEDALSGTELDPALPALEDLDAVWGLARQRLSGQWSGDGDGEGAGDGPGAGEGAGGGAWFGPP
jgi:hypothetical protein